MRLVLITSLFFAFTCSELKASNISCSNLFNRPEEIYYQFTHYYQANSSYHTERMNRYIHFNIQNQLWAKTIFPQLYSSDNTYNVLLVTIKDIHMRILLNGKDVPYFNFETRSVVIDGNTI